MLLWMVEQRVLGIFSVQLLCVLPSLGGTAARARAGSIAFGGPRGLRKQSSPRARAAGPPKLGQTQSS